VRFAHRGRPQLLKRRDYVRATVALPLTLRAVGADEPTVTAHAQALDLSGGGMLVRGLPNPALDDAHAFELALDGGTPIRGRGRVVRLVGLDRAGLQFTLIADEDRERIMNAAFDMSRDQRRRFS
jgi:c-di-GMP-binding flagellar brake protein YcgR